MSRLLLEIAGKPRSFVNILGRLEKERLKLSYRNLMKVFNIIFQLFSKYASRGSTVLSIIVGSVKSRNGLLLYGL